jgi:hypothetical protein
MAMAALPECGNVVFTTANLTCVSAPMYLISALAPASPLARERYRSALSSQTTYRLFLGKPVQGQDVNSTEQYGLCGNIRWSTGTALQL